MPIIVRRRVTFLQFVDEKVQRDTLDEECYWGAVMKKSSPETASMTLYLLDLEAQIHALDAQIFVGHPSAVILISDDYPELGIPGERVGTMASFLYEMPRPAGDSSIVSFPKKSEGYIVWRTGIERKISFIARHPEYQGLGDASLRDFWLLTAISLVRARVLNHQKWFPLARLRTIESMAKHIKLFGEDGFVQLRKLPDELAAELTVASATELDMQLTQRLFVAAVTHGATHEDAFSLLTTN
jgi:hypothetical protein